MIEHWEKELVDNCSHESKYRIIDDRDATIVCAKCCIVLSNATYIHPSLTRQATHSVQAKEIYDISFRHEIGGGGGGGGEEKGENASVNYDDFLQNLGCLPPPPQPRFLPYKNEFPSSSCSYVKNDMFDGGEEKEKCSKGQFSAQFSEKTTDGQILTQVRVKRKQMISDIYVLLDWTANANLPRGIVNATMGLFNSHACQQLINSYPRAKIQSKTVQEVELLAGCLFLCLMKYEAARTYCFLAFYTGVSEERLSSVVTFLTSHLQEHGRQSICIEMKEEAPAILDSLKPSIWMPLFSSEFLLTYQNELIVKNAADYWQNEYSFSPLTLIMTSIYLFYTRRPEQLLIWWRDQNESNSNEKEERNSKRRWCRKRISLRLKLDQTLKMDLATIPASALAQASAPAAAADARNISPSPSSSRMVATLKKRIIQVSGLNPSTLNRAIKKIESELMSDIISTILSFSLTTLTSSATVAK